MLGNKTGGQGVTAERAGVGGAQTGTHTTHRTDGASGGAELVASSARPSPRAAPRPSPLSRSAPEAAGRGETASLSPRPQFGGEGRASDSETEGEGRVAATPSTRSLEELPNHGRIPPRPLSEIQAAARNADRVAIWEGILHTGEITLLYSKAKTGKSFLLWGLLGALAKENEEFIGRPLMVPAPQGEQEKPVGQVKEIVGQTFLSAGRDAQGSGQASLLQSQEGVHASAESNSRQTRMSAPLSPVDTGNSAPLSQSVSVAARCPTVILTEEDEMIMNLRINTFKIPRTAPVGAYMRYDPRVTNRPFLEILCEAMEDLALRRGKLLVIDTLNAWAGIELNLEQKPRECAEFLERLRSAARLGGFAVLILHHAKRSAQTARGCEALRGSVDTLVYLQCPYEGCDARVLHISQPSRTDIPVCPEEGGDENVASRAARLAYEYSPFDGFFETEGASAADAVWFALPRSGEGVTAVELMERTGLSIRGVYKAVEKLSDQGRVKVEGDGKKMSPYVFRRASI